MPGLELYNPSRLATGGGHMGHMCRVPQIRSSVDESFLGGFLGLKSSLGPRKLDAMGVGLASGKLRDNPRHVCLTFHGHKAEYLS